MCVGGGGGGGGGWVDGCMCVHNVKMCTCLSLQRGDNKIHTIALVSLYRLVW